MLVLRQINHQIVFCLSSFEVQRSTDIITMFPESDDFRGLLKGAYEISTVGLVQTSDSLLRFEPAVGPERE